MSEAQIIEQKPAWQALYHTKEECDAAVEKFEEWKAKQGLLDGIENCYLCGGPLAIDGNCEAYHWHDRIHLLNRIKIEGWDHSGLFHSKAELLSAPPLEFLIDGFLPSGGATAIAAPVAMRKTLIALNIARSLLTGEPLFGHFKVLKKPKRVIYLVPEVSLSSFANRLTKVGLMNYVGGPFLCRTMNAQGKLKLSDEALREYLPGAVVILDTAIRFIEGNENESSEMRTFADEVFALMRDGADSVVLLHHSAKGTQSSNELTLDNAMRGSGELGAFLSTCWATRLQDPTEPYKSASYLVNVKQRDFESKPFEVTSTPDGRLHIVPDSVGNVTLGKSTAEDEAALAFMRAQPSLSERKMRDAMHEAGIKKGREWIRTAKFTLLQERGGKL